MRNLEELLADGNAIEEIPPVCHISSFHGNTKFFITRNAKLKPLADEQVVYDKFFGDRRARKTCHKKTCHRKLARLLGVGLFGFGGLSLWQVFLFEGHRLVSVKLLCVTLIINKVDYYYYY
jgi:hypothetical protein